MRPGYIVLIRGFPNSARTSARVQGMVYCMDARWLRSRVRFVSLMWFYGQRVEHMPHHQRVRDPIKVRVCLLSASWTR